MDVSGFGTMDDYAQTLSRKARWNLKDRRARLQRGGLVVEQATLSCSNGHALLDELWPLFKGTGERNGFVYTQKEDFERMHLTTPGLFVITMRVSSGRAVGLLGG